MLSHSVFGGGHVRVGIVELFVLFAVLPLLGFGVAAYLLGTARRAAVMDEQLARARRHQVGISVLAGAVAIVTMPLRPALTPWLGQDDGAARAALADGGRGLPGAVGRRA